MKDDHLCPACTVAGNKTLIARPSDMKEYVCENDDCRVIRFRPGD